MDKIKLFCIPYSGASASVYTVWKKYLPEQIALYPIELSGHGKRVKAPLYDNLEQAVKDVVISILKQLKKGEPYAIIGHSMGALLAYEVYYKLMELGVHQPCHMFFSGRKAPQDQKEQTAFYAASDDEFLKIVYIYGGTTPAVMQNKELRELFLPMLRSDFKITETYVWKEREAKIQCPITVINGKSDTSVANADMGHWRQCTQDTCSILECYGDHFFLVQDPEKMAGILAQQLRPHNKPIQRGKE